MVLWIMARAFKFINQINHHFPQEFINILECIDIIPVGAYTKCMKNSWYKGLWSRD